MATNSISLGEDLVLTRNMILVMITKKQILKKSEEMMMIIYVMIIKSMNFINLLDLEMIVKMKQQEQTKTTMLLYLMMMLKRRKRRRRRRIIILVLEMTIKMNLKKQSTMRILLLLLKINLIILLSTNPVASLERQHTFQLEKVSVKNSKKSLERRKDVSTLSIVQLNLTKVTWNKSCLLLTSMSFTWQQIFLTERREETRDG